MGLDAYLHSDGREIGYFRKDHATRDFIVNSFADGDFDAAYGADIPLNTDQILLIINNFYRENILGLLETEDSSSILWASNRYTVWLKHWINAYGYAIDGHQVSYSANW